MVYSGIANTLLINGTTAHSTFQIHTPLLPDSTCNIKRQSARAQFLRDTTIFIWDEASMIPANALEDVDVLLRDITQINKTFGGKFIFLGVDFRQVLLVVLRAGRAETVQQCIIYSLLWLHFQQFQLVTNTRAIEDHIYREFSEWLLRSGTGDEARDEEDQVTLPQEIMAESLQDMIKCYQIVTNHPIILFNASPALTVYQHKHLGIILDSKLSFSAHIQAAINKSRRAIGVFGYSNWLLLKSDLPLIPYIVSTIQKGLHT